jgi:hypothetical protein
MTPTTHRVALIALMACGSPVRAQVDTSAKSASCEAAQTAFAARQPMADDGNGIVQWPQTTLPSCGIAAARVVARELSTETGNSDPDSLLRVMRFAASFRDATILRTFLTIAGDSGAPPNRG